MPEAAEKRGPIEKTEKGWPINPVGLVALIFFGLIIIFYWLQLSGSEYASTGFADGAGGAKRHGNGHLRQRAVFWRLLRWGDRRCHFGCLWWLECVCGHSRNWFNMAADRSDPRSPRSKSAAVFQLGG